jgi:hypothetical protein
MGTLTAGCPRLDAHCPHKLATSCRLTSTLNCCACADERAHSRTYRVYIDGIGFVQRGTRWQGYCWFCKGMFAREEQCAPMATLIRSDRVLVEPACLNRSPARDSSNPYPRDSRSDRVLGTMERVPPRLSHREAPRWQRAAHAGNRRAIWGG